MKHLWIAFAALALVACGQKYEGKKLVGSGSYRYVYYDDAKLSNLTLKAISDLEGYENVTELSTIDKLNKKFVQALPSAKVGANIAKVMGERFQLKRVQPDMKVAYGDYINGRMDKESAADYWLIVNTPAWRLKKSIWTGQVTMQYVIQYRLVDVKTQKNELGNSCIYESEKHSAKDFVKNDFSLIRDELGKIAAYCDSEVVQAIDPNKSGYLRSKRLY